MKFEAALAALRQGKKIRRYHSSKREYLFLDRETNQIYGVIYPTSPQINPDIFIIRDPSYILQHFATDDWESFECDTSCIFCKEFCGITDLHRVRCLAFKDEIWGITAKQMACCNHFSINPELALHDSSLNALSYTD